MLLRPSYPLKCLIACLRFVCKRLRKQKLDGKQNRFFTQFIYCCHGKKFTNWMFKLKYYIKIVGTLSDGRAFHCQLIHEHKLPVDINHGKADLLRLFMFPYAIYLDDSLQSLRYMRLSLADRSSV